MTELETLFAALATSGGGGGGAVLATLVRVNGSAYRGPGARMLVTRDGATVGAISGGCLEKDVVAHAESVRRTGAPRLVSWDLTRDDDAPWGLNMGCNAKLNVLLEPLGAEPPAWLAELVRAEQARETIVVTTSLGNGQLGVRRVARARNGVRPGVTRGALREVLAPPIQLVACGDGPDVPPLVALASSLGWHARQVGKDQEPGALDERSAAVVMTHNYGRDLALLKSLLKSKAGYIGVLGPRARTARLLKDLKSKRRLHSPVGLDIGAESPAEIALSICAEIRAVFAHRDGGPLRKRRKPIHDR